MKKTLVLALLLLSVVENSFSQEKALKIYNGKFAFCGASGAERTKDTIMVQGKKFILGVSICPVMEGPINEAAVPLRRAMRVFPGETSITQAPVGASYPVGTIIPEFKK